MANDLTIQGEVIVSSEKAEQAFDRLGDKAERMAGDVAGAAGKAGKAVDGIGDGAEKGAEKFTRAESRISASIKKATTELELLGKTASQKLEFNIADKGLDAAKFEPALQKLREIEAQATKAQQVATGSLDKMGISAKQTAAALRGVPAQFTDIMVSLQGGQAPLTVFLQQGGQLKDMFGGAGNAARALGGYVLGLVNPLTILAAAAAGVALAYNQGSREADAYRAAMVTTGNAAGVTTGQLKSYAQEIAGVVGTQGKAAESLSAFTASGKIASETLKDAAQAAIQWERVTGQAVSKTAAEFAGLRNEPLSAVLKLNDGTNFLTESIYKQIKSLDEQGRTADAAAVAQRAYADALTGRAGEMERNLGAIEGAWKRVKDAAKAGWDAMLNLGRQATSQDQLADTRKEIARLESQMAGGFGETAGGAATGRPSSAAQARVQAEVTALRAKEAALQGVISASEASARQDSDRAKSMQAVVEWDKAGVKFLSDRARMERDLTVARNEGVAAGKSQAEIEERLGQIRESYRKKGGGSTAAENKDLRDQQRIYAELAGVSSTYYSELANYQKQRAAGVVTEQQYVQAVETLIARQPFHIAQQKAIADAQKAAADAQKILVKAYEDEVKAQQKLVEQRQKSADQVEESLTKAKEEEQAHIMAAATGMTLAEALARIALARAEDNYQKAAGADADGATLLALQREIEARKGLIEVMQSRGVRDANTKAASDAAKEWEKTSKLIGDTLADYIMGGGKDAASYLKRLFATLVLQPTVNYLASGVMGLLGMGGGGSGGSGIMGLANSGQSAYSLFSGNNPMVNTIGGWLGYGGSSAGAAGAAAGMVPTGGIAGGYGGAATAAAGSVPTGTAGAGMAGVGAFGAIVGAAALGWIISDYLDKGDSFSGAAYATSGGDDPYTQVTPGALNPNMDTGDRPDREAMLARLRALGAPEEYLNVNDRTLHRMLLLSGGNKYENAEQWAAGNPGDEGGGGFLNWSEWSKNNAGLTDFYQGQGYASPEQMGWFEQQDMGGRADDRQWDSFFQDPAVITASRQLAEGILAPIKSISDMLGNDDAYKVATGMAWNNKTGKITGGLQVWEGDESVLNWGSKEFENKDEYLRSTLSDSLGVLETMDGVPEWLKKQVDGAQEEMAKLEGENIGQRASEIFAAAANSVAATFKQIETLIGIIPDLAGLSQDAVYSIGQAFGSLENYTGAYSGYVQNYYSDEERAGYVRGGINSSLADYGLSVDENTTREDYRKLIEAQDLTTESGRKAYAALILASDAFAQITPAAEEAAKVLAFMDDLLKTRKDLEAEWLAATGDLAGAERMRREQAIEGMKEEEIAQYDANEALRARIETEKEFQATISGISGSLTSVLTEGLLGNLSQADLGGQMADAVIGGVYNALANNAAKQITDMMMSTIIDPLVRAALTGSITAQTVSQAAIDNMVANARAVVEALGAVFNDPAFKDVMAKINQMIKDIAGSAPSTPYYAGYTPVQQTGWVDTAVRDAGRLTNAWEGVGDTLLDQVKRIRGDIADSGMESLSYWQSEFAIETAKARSGDVDAAKGLSALSSSLLDAAGKESETQLALQQMRAWVAQSLQDTAAYANAFAGGQMTPRPPQPANTVITPAPAFNQAPVVISADPGLIAEVRELKALVRLMSEQQLEDLRIERKREAIGMPPVRTEGVTA